MNRLALLRRACLLLDYAGCGLSDGLFADYGADHLTKPGYEQFFRYVDAFGLNVVPYPNAEGSPLPANSGQMTMLGGKFYSETMLADPATREKAQNVFVRPLLIVLDQLRSSLQAQPISLATLPPELVSSWKTKDGKVRVEVTPRGDSNDNETLRNFADAVLAAEPTAIGGPVSILKSGDTIVKAFIHAGLWALLSIGLLLWIVLRRFSDVMMTLVPLLVAGAVTLEICVLIGMPLNFANIVALPLMLGVGVAFKIYYVTAWRAGRTNLLQSSLTRAIFFSALTTATAFGSLWLSSHPGTASMGKLLALSLLTTLAAVLLFQPALMGKPRNVGE